jgi:hypothetical protein
MKPKHLETKYAGIFKHKGIAEAYIYRQPYILTVTTQGIPAL